jgi:ASC-1-like (ASCH) protein
MESWQWIFVFFVILMAVRIAPRILKQRRMNMQKSGGVTTEQPFFSESKEQSFVKESDAQSFGKATTPESKDMLVLGLIVRGYKTFDEIRKKTGFDSKDLNTILEDLEKRELMKVQQKKGLIGIKVELLPTEKGYREYDS